MECPKKFTRCLDKLSNRYNRQVTMMTQTRVVQPVPRFWIIRYNTADTLSEPEAVQYKHRNSMGVVASDASSVLHMAKENGFVVHQLNHGGEVSVIADTSQNVGLSYWSIEARLSAPSSFTSTSVIGVVANSIHDAVLLATKYHVTEFSKGYNVEILSANKRGTVHTIVADQFVAAAYLS